MQGFGALFQGDIKANFSSIYPQSSRTKLSWKVGGLYWRMLSCLFVTVLDIYKVWVMVNAVVVFTALYLYTHSCYLSHMCAHSLTHFLLLSLFFPVLNQAVITMSSCLKMNPLSVLL